MNVLLIKNGVVDNCICADSLERAQQFYPDHTCIQQTGALGVGWTYDGQAFTAPVVVPGPKSAITKLEFLRRFPAEKRIAIRAAAVTDPILSDALALLDLAQDVRTDDQDTMRLVGYCEMQGFLTATEAAVILE